MGRCEQDLEKRIYDEYHYAGESAYDEKVIKIFAYSYDQLRQMKAANSWEAGIDIPLAEALLSFGGSSDSSREEFESLRQQYFSGIDSTVRSRVRVEFSKRVVSAAGVDAYKACLASISRESITHEIAGNPTKSNDFGVSITYSPRDAEDSDWVRLESVGVSSNLVMAGSTRLVEGAQLYKFSSIVQAFQRTNDDAAWIQVAFKGRGPALTISFPPFPPPPLVITPQRKIVDVSIRGRKLPSYIPPHRGNGDKDFDGKVFVDARAAIVVKGSRVIVQLEMKAQETEADWTRAEGVSSTSDDSYVLYTTRPGEKILRVKTPRTLFDTASFFAKGFLGGHNPINVKPDEWNELVKKLPPMFARLYNAAKFSKNGLVDAWHFVCDTKGNEAGTRTSVAVTLNELVVEVERDA